MMKHIILPLFLIFGAFTFTVAQNTTNLPTSFYGVGELNMSDGGHYAGIGNMGIALNKMGFQNTLNPAAITRMDTTCFTFDVGMVSSYSRYSFLGNHSSNNAGNPNRINMSFRVLPRWYAMIGFAPFSSVGYVIQTQEQVEGTANSTVNSLFEGNGGLYRFYLTNAYALTKHLSIGANIGFVSGSINQTETQEGTTITYESKKKAFYADFGMHYEFSTSNKRNWSLGFVYALPFALKQKNDLTYSSSSTSNDMDVPFSKVPQYLPQRIGGGIAMSTPRWVITADYNWLDWSRNSPSTTLEEYQNQHKINLGTIYTVNTRTPRSIELMGGVGYNNSYIMINDGKMSNLEVSAGVSFPIRYSYLSLGATWRKQMNTRKDLMQETRWSFNLNVTFGERISRFKLK